MGGQVYKVPSKGFSDLVPTKGKGGFSLKKGGKSHVKKAFSTQSLKKYI